MNCEDATNLIVARIDGELSDADRTALDAHLATCAACLAVADELSAQHADLRRAFAPHRAATTAVADRVIRRFNAEGLPAATGYSRPQTSWWARYGRPIVAAAAGFALALLVTRPWQRGPNPSVSLNRSTTNPSVATAPAARPVAQLALATGAVFVCPSGSNDWRPLESGGPVQAGMKVRTGPKVRCEFKMDDGSEVRLNSQTEVTLASARRVDVASGQVFSSVQKQPAGEQFVVKAAPTQATLTALGTTFDVSCESARTTLTVLDGSVEVDARGSKNVVKGGEALTVAADGRLEDKRQVQNLMQATQWVDEVLVLKGRDNPELARRIDDIFAQLGHEKMWYMQAQEVRRLGDHCVVPLCRYVESDRSKRTDGDRMKRREAARIVADVATTWAIPELINLLNDDDGDVRYAASQALQRLTGQNLGRRPEQWRDQNLMTCVPTIETWHSWWEKNKNRYPGADADAVRPLEVVKQAPDLKTKG